MKKFDPTDSASVARMTRAIDQAICDGDGGREWEDLCDLAARAMTYYDDPNFAKDLLEQ